MVKGVSPTIVENSTIVGLTPFIFIQHDEPRDPNVTCKMKMGSHLGNSSCRPKPSVLKAISSEPS